MEAEEYQKREMIAYEAFIRRASMINSPFMLKGSYVTRQYFQYPADRIPADLDWVYMHKISSHIVANELFSDWVTAITELDLDDGVTFRSFRENDFWRMIDYAMADDFPTVNTDLKCWVDETVVDLHVDISFNLDIEQPPVSLEYRPVRGEGFIIPNTVPLSLQVSWKIHQTLVRPRFKDLYDLTHLVNHSAFDQQELEKSFQALLNECKTDNVDLSKLRSFLTYDIAFLFPDNTLEETWEYWRHGRLDGQYNGRPILYFDKAILITKSNSLPFDLSTFLNNFRQAMEQKGWTLDLIKDLNISPVIKQPPVSDPVDTEVKKTKRVEEEVDILDEATKSISFWERIKRMIRK